MKSKANRLHSPLNRPPSRQPSRPHVQQPKWALATISAAMLSLLPALASANPPSQPGQPSGSINGSTVNLSWVESTDDRSVAGYNVYINNRYVDTVPQARYTGNIDTSRANSVYVVAFDALDNNGNRFFSARSAEKQFDVQTTVSSGNTGNSNQNTTTNNSTGPVPTAPTSLNASRTSPTTVSLTWTESVDDQRVAGYNVYRNDRYLTTVSNPRLNDIQLASGVEYSYYVVAFDEPRNFSPKSAEVSTAGNSAPTTPVAPAAPQQPNEQPSEQPAPTSGPDTQKPSVVQNIQAQINSDGSIAVQWNAGADNVGVEGYNLYRNRNYLTTLFQTSFIDRTAPTGEDVSYAVASFDAARNFSVTSPYSLATSESNTGSTPVTDPDVKGNPPTLRDPFAAPIASPPSSDPFGAALEIDTEAAVAGGPPTQPKNLRAELVSNDWAEINWAPSNDDGEVVEYRIYRSDGVVYTIREDQTLSNTANQAEIDRFWNSTLFIDCNYTRFFQEVHDCASTTPSAGDEFTYQVSAVDNDGMESARSEPLEVIYHVAENAPIPYYNDFYKDNDDTFVQDHDLSRVEYFIDDFISVFSDDFNGSEINSNYWNTSLVWGDTRIINGEQQYFVNTQDNPDFGYNPFNLTGDTLKIESIATPENLVENLPPVCDEVDPFGKERCAFLSGALSSHDKFGLTYGYVESRMKVGSGAGSLSSFYLYHRYPGTGNTAHAPEIDIIEYLGENPFGDELAFQTHHYDNVIDGSTNSAPTMSYANPDGTKFDEDFHTYGVLWEPQLVIWYIDGKEIKRMTGPQVGRQQMNIVTYLVSGSAWAPTPDVNADIFPLEFEIDYIKAYQRPPYNTNGVYPD